MKRHDAIVAYLKRAVCKNCEEVDKEPHIQTAEGLPKPDLVAKHGKTAMVVDAQVVSEQTNLDEAHKRKLAYYRGLEEDNKHKYSVDHVKFTSATSSCGCIWSKASVDDLIDLRIILKEEIKILSTRALIGGLSSFWVFNKSTSTASRQGRTGIV